MNPSSHAYNSVNDTEKRRDTLIANPPIPGGLSHHSHANSLTVKPFLHNSRIKEIMVEIMNFNSVKQNDVF